MAARFNNLTVARFAAALMVYMSHIQPPESAAITSDAVRRFVGNGYVGVSFFFIVSGFVLAASNLGKFDTINVRGVASFYWKRAARIVPLWLVASSPFIWKAATTDGHGLWQFLTFSQAWDPDLSVAFGLLAVAWSLSVEMFFYLVFPFLAFAIKRLDGAWAPACLIALGLLIPTAGAVFFAIRSDLAHLPITDAGSPHYWLYRFPPMRLGEFLTGIGLYMALARTRETMRPARHSLGLMAVAGLTVTMATIPTGGAWLVVPAVFFFALIVWYLARIETAGIKCTSSALIMLGEASFALYLVHHFYFKKKLFISLLGDMDLHSAQVATLMLAIASSVGLHLLVEAPAREWLLRLGKVRSTMPAPVVDETVPA